jgi:hypothetical protein
MFPQSLLIHVSKDLAIYGTQSTTIKLRMVRYGEGLPLTIWTHPTQFYVTSTAGLFMESKQCKNRDYFLAGKNFKLGHSMAFRSQYLRGWKASQLARM